MGCGIKYRELIILFYSGLKRNLTLHQKAFGFGSDELFIKHFSLQSIILREF